MSVDETEIEDKIAAWPAPLKLTQQNGEVFVTLLQGDNYIEAKWAGHITASNVVTACKMLLQVIQRHPCPALLNNKADVTGDWADANDWLEYEWLPKAILAGLRCMAHVYSNNMFSRLSARDLYLRLTPRLSMSNFCEREEALSWLIEHSMSAEGEASPAPQI